MPDGQDRMSNQGGSNSLSSPPLAKLLHCAFYPGILSFRQPVVINQCAQKPFLLATPEGFLTYSQPILTF